MDQQDLRAVADRRHVERRQVVPDSMKPFLGWMIAEERRLTERRVEDRRQFVFTA